MTVNNLADFQQLWSDNLLSAQVDADLLDELNKINSGQQQQRFSVYRNNVMHSLCVALGDLYITVKRLLGEMAFNHLAVNFIQRFPPQHPKITFLGEQFADFIDTFLAQQAVLAQRGSDSLVYLSDVARLEWLMHLSYYAEDEPLLDLLSLQRVDAEQMGRLCLQVNAAVHLMESRWPVVDIWQENLKDEPNTLCIDGIAATKVLIYRQDYSVKVMALDVDCFSLLSLISSGHCLDDAMQQLEQVESEEQSAMLAFLLGLPLFSHYQLAQ